MFVIIMVSICKHSARPAVTNTSNKSYKLRNVSIAAGLSLVLGLGWGFGLVASSNKINALTCVLQFLFSVFVGSQGLLYLLAHGVRNKDARKVWGSWICLRSKSYTVTLSSVPKDGTADRSENGSASSQNKFSSLPMQDTSTNESEKPPESEEKLLESESLQPDVKEYTISIEENEVTGKNLLKSFKSLSLIKNDVSRVLRSFRSEGQFARIQEHVPET